jgi:hypothetical protein
VTRHGELSTETLVGQVKGGFSGGEGIECGNCYNGEVALVGEVLTWDGVLAEWVGEIWGGSGSEVGVCVFGKVAE